MTSNHTTLPGTKIPYVLRAGHGDRFLAGNQLVTFIARPADTGNLFEAAIVSADKGAEFPLHLHPAGRECIYLLHGTLDLALAGKTYRMSPGDCAAIPPGTTHGYKAQSHHTRIMLATFGGQSLNLFAALGDRYTGYMYPAEAPQPILLDRLRNLDALDVQACSNKLGLTAPLQPLETVLPAGEVPYVIEAGEGSRLVVADQLFGFLARGRNTNGHYLTLINEGPAGQPVPLHFHEKHTEFFFCIEGQMTMQANGEQVTLGPGDLLHCPAGTVHSYRLTAPHNLFLGFLAPAIFEPFFDYLGDPWQSYIYPQQPLPFRFDRVLEHIQELDLKLAEPALAMAGGNTSAERAMSSQS